MPVPSSSLSVICDHIRDFVRTGIDAAANNVGVTVGSPGGLDTGTEHLLNLFFYRFEPSGFESGARPVVPWNIRMFCMVTPFAIDEQDGAGSTVSAGENDMRILGDVMRVFHENPILPVVNANGVGVRTRIVFMSTSDEQINQIWSTQGDEYYRPSAVYEMSLTPIVPRELMPEPAIVGEIGLEVRANGNRHAAFGGIVAGPPVPAQNVDFGDPGWTPATALVWKGDLFQTLSLDVDGADFAAFTPEVWLAGDPAATVQLVWQAWRTTGWESVGAPQNATPLGSFIDPDDIPVGAPGFPIVAPLPEAPAASAASLQLMLFAERSFTLHAGGPTEVARSAPILITLYRILP